MKNFDPKERLESVLLFGGKILEMDTKNSCHEAILIKNGQVEALGTFDDMSSKTGTKVKKIDLEGRTVMPGLVDSHPHLIHWAGFSHAVVPLFDARNFDDIVNRIREAAEQTPEGEWIQCSPIGEPHYFMRRSYQDMEEGELPNRHVLDLAAPKHPVWIQAWAPVNPNITVFNSRGLSRIQVSRNTPDLIGRVSIEKDYNGEPTGRMMGPVNNYYNNEPWWDQVLESIYKITADDWVDGTREAMREANTRGITSIFEGHIMDWPLIDVYRYLQQEDELRLRVLCTPDGEPHGVSGTRALDMQQLQGRLEHAITQQELTNDFLRIESFLCTRGGPINPGMLIMHRHYRDAYGRWTNGLEFLPPEKGELMINFAAERGIRLNIISCGDREHDVTLSQLDAANKRWNISDKHWLLVHAYMMSDEHTQRYRDLGFGVTTSMGFSHFKMHTVRERMGSDLLKDFIPLNRLCKSGMPVACGTDWGPKNAFEHMMFAQNNIGVFGDCNNTPAHPVDRLTALRHWTTGGAEVMRWPGIGILSPGTYADLVVLDQDPLACELEQLPGTHVAGTMVDGYWVYNDGSITT